MIFCAFVAPSFMMMAWNAQSLVAAARTEIVPIVDDPKYNLIVFASAVPAIVPVGPARRAAVH